MRKPRKVPQKKSNSLFKKTSTRVHKKNAPSRSPMRGGIRL